MFTQFGILPVDVAMGVIVSWLLLVDMDNFTPKFSQRAVQELKQTIRTGKLPDSSPPPSRWHRPGMF